MGHTSLGAIPCSTAFPIADVGCTPVGHRGSSRGRLPGSQIGLVPHNAFLSQEMETAETLAEGRGVSKDHTAKPFDHLMQSTPLITVVIPNYNHGRFLKRRLDSVLQQTFQDFEVIILDDASTDNSRELIEQYRHHPKVRRVEFNTVNTGRPIKQWLKGIALAETEWIWIAESDDYCDVRFLEALQPALADPETVLAYHEVEIVREDGTLVWSPPGLTATWYNGKVFLKEKLLPGCVICNAGMAVFRKSACTPDISLYDPFVYAPDHYFWSMLVSKGKVFASGQKLAWFQKHAHEFTHGKVGSSAEDRDHAMLLEQLLANGQVQKPEVAAVVREKMITMACARKGMDPDDYTVKVEIWKQLQQQQQLWLSAAEITWATFLRKWKHWSRSAWLW